VELALFLVLVGLAVVGVLLGRRIRASSGTIGATVPPGSPGRVQAPLEPTGTVLLAGETWTARTADERHLERATRVRLVRFDGLTAIVEPVDAGTPSPPTLPPDTPAEDRT
jgi:membrane protein implicated in regulation of membrane protease activity